MDNADVNLNNTSEFQMIIDVMKTMFPVCIRVNLTKNEYHIIECSLFNIRSINNIGNYDNFIRRIISDIPDRRQKRKFEETFSSDSIIKAYEENKKEISYRYRHKTSGMEYSSWLESKAFIVVNNGELNAVFTTKPIDAEMRQLNEFKKDSIYKKAIFSDDIITLFECNLSLNLVTSDIYEIKNGVERVKTDEMGLTPPFTVTAIAQKAWMSSDHESNNFNYSNMINCDYLINLYENGNSTPEFTFWEKMSDGQKHCLKNTFYITTSEETGDVMAFSILKDITLIQKEQDANDRRKIMLDGISSDYECVFSINFNTYDVTVYRAIKLFKQCRTFENGKEEFLKVAMNMINELVYEPDRKYLCNAFKRDKIIREIKTNNMYCISFRMIVDDEPQYYQAKITAPDGNKECDDVVVAVHNVNIEMRAEAERIKQIQIQQITNMQQEAVIKSISNDFEGIYYINLDTNDAITYRTNSIFNKYIKPNKEFGNIYEYIISFAEKLVFYEDREDFIKAFNKDKIMFELTKSSVYYINFRMFINGEILYYRIKIMKDNLLVGTNNLIIGLQNVDAYTRRELEQNRTLEILQEKERNYQKAVFSDASGFFECNLSKNLVISDIFELIDGEFQIVTDAIEMKPPFKFDEFKKWFVETHDVPNPKEVINFINCDNLIRCYKNGNHMPEFTYWARTPSGIMRCHREIFFLTKDDKSGDIMALSIIKDVSEQQKKADELQQYHDIIEVLASEYTSLFLVNIETLKVIPYYIYSDIDNRFGCEIKSGHLDYLDIINLYLDSVIYEEDIEHVAEITSIDYIKEQFKKVKSFSSYTRRYENEDIRYYELRFIKVGNSPEPTEFVLGLLDRNEQIRKEQEHQKHLQIAMERAEAANHAKSTFLFNMSHDIRTPMNAIIGFTSMAQKYIENKERVNEYLEKVKISSTHLLKLINDVLDMARIESGKVTIEETETEIHKTINEVVMMMQESAKEKNIVLKSAINDIRNEHVFIDILHFNQIMLNVISNAIKYTRNNGNVNITVYQTPDEKDGYASFDFIISDNGIGMSSEFTKHIFESFMREQTSTVSGIQGTGLGMSITKNLVDLMGGNISVMSELGVGTTVKIHISFRVLQSIPEVTEAIEESNDVELEGMRILLVEDNELNREIAKDILEEAGIIVEEADDGSVAVEMVSESDAGYYDLILMDIQMPYMDGYKATQTIRAFENRELADVPIIAMTANAFEEDKNKALESGMNSHLAKPINIGELFETLKIFGGKRRKL